MILTFCSACVVCALANADDGEVHIGYLFSDGQIPVTVAAYERLFERFPELRERVRLVILSESTFDTVVAEDLMSVDTLVYDVMNEQMLARFNERHAVNLLALVNRRGRVIGVGQGFQSDDQYAEQGVFWDAKARAYWAASGLDNHTGLAALAVQIGGLDADGLELPAPQAALAGGYYYSGPGGGNVFPSWTEFDAWRKANGKIKQGAPRIAIGFYRANYYGNELAIVDALIAEIERSGAIAIPFFGYPAHLASREYLIDEAGDARADVMLASLFRFAQPDMSNVLGSLDVPIINLITLYGRSAEEWENSETGLSLFEGTFQVASPELAGLIAPTVVGSREVSRSLTTGADVVRQTPIPAQVERAVARALGLAQLAAKPNAQKKLALSFFNYPAGAAGISASYLNVAESIANILQHLATAGYNVGQGAIDADSIQSALVVSARNIAGYAPGELAEFVRAHKMPEVSLASYRAWFSEMDPKLQAKIDSDWGDVANNRLMVNPDSGALLIPGIRFGNVLVFPQPIRGWGEDDEQLYHAADLAPHHQYVATYLWAKHEFKADAVLHLGTHGTLEWLDGKDTGLSDSDAPEALISDLPHIYPYNVDVVGEGLIARRRSAATLIDHMVPPFVQGGLYAEVAELSERISSYHQNLRKNPQLANEYARDIYHLIETLGLNADLNLNLTTGATTEGFDDHPGEKQDAGTEAHFHDARNSRYPRRIDHDVIHTLEDYIAHLKAENIPYGLHAIGRLPSEVARRTTAQAIAAVDRSLIGAASDKLQAELEENIVQSAELELTRLTHALEGGYIPGGTGGEPIRNPDAYPTGKNFFGIDPDKVPTKAAWRLGEQLAKQLLEEHRETNDGYPNKVSFVIWGDETIRHEGIVESQIFYLLGAKPIWNDRDKVVDVEIIPRAELDRPRVDIVIASAAEGMFHNVTNLMDKAVQLVKALDEPDNQVRQNYLDVRQSLIEFGYTPELAARHAGVRIFDEAPGSYNLNVSRITEASGTWDSDVSLAHDYLRKMGHGYGNGFWGEPMEDVFRLTLSGTDKVVHSSSTMLYGGLDNDDFYMYAGGLANAVKTLDGQAPSLVVTNTRNPSSPRMTGIDEFLGTEMRTRYFNPNWIQGMQSEGYAGAGEMRAFVEYLWGWDATVTDTVEDRDWNEVFSTYVQDRHGLELRSFFDEHSPSAYQDMTARMLEVTRKGYWDATEQVRQALAKEFLDSVIRNGFTCSEITCGNPRLLEYLLETAAESGFDQQLLDEFERETESRMQRDIQQAARQDEAFAEANEERIRRRNAMLEDGIDPVELDADQEELSLPKHNSSAERAEAVSTGPASIWLYFLLILIALSLVLGGRRLRAQNSS
ncbi:MAG: cobaltochelatase subunit CobN [Pseudomonadota bacterium]